jgi:hypothetical protein
MKVLVEDGFHFLINRGLREVNVEFLEGGNAAVVPLEIVA